MQVLNVSNLKMEFGDYILFDKVSFSLNDRDRLALIGPNGNGKTTILKILLGQLEKTSGEVSFARSINIGYLSQDVISNLDNTVYEEVSSVFKDLMIQEENLKKLESRLNNKDEVSFKGHRIACLLFEVATLLKMAILDFDATYEDMIEYLSLASEYCYLSGRIVNIEILCFEEKR